ncbi:hypothetical protein C1646_666646 [Rhizophagus diaphanus]|nr:hypothetical protein C1646_666646 [Rhizophagus diaphanus] [Rhizophagus sp. MUCL 43196]
MLEHEAHIYSILKECRAVPRLLYKVLQLIEGAHHVDPERITKKEKKIIVNQLKPKHNCGVLHNDISKSRHYFFIDFGLSEIVDNGRRNCARKKIWMYSVYVRKLETILMIVTSTSLWALQLGIRIT